MEKSTVAERVRNRRSAKTMADAQLAERMRTKQRELRRQKANMLKQRFESGQITKSFKNDKLINAYSLKAFQDVSLFPKELEFGKVYLCNSKSCLFVPINFNHLPIHVLLIKMITTYTQSNYNVLKLVFYTHSKDQKDKQELDIPTFSENQNILFIKELEIKSASTNFDALIKRVRELQRITSFELTHKKSPTVNPEPTISLQSSQAKETTLSNLFLRSDGFSWKRSRGVLISQPGYFKFVLSGQETLQIPYTNVKHLFFHPMSRDLVALIHLTLKESQLYQKKKMTQVQFYCEQSQQYEDVTNIKNNFLSEQREIELEEAEIQERQRINSNFKTFLQKSLIHTSDYMEYEFPDITRSFVGVVYNTSTTLIPTNSCLVSLIDWPAFVFDLKDIEIVNFERVILGIRHFDMVIITTSFDKAVTISNVHAEKLDMIKLWLNDNDIVWYECKNNFNWTVVLNEIRKDFAEFVRGNGFNSLLGDDEDLIDENGEDSEEDEDEDDVDYNSSSDVSCSESDDEDEQLDEEDLDEEYSKEEDEVIDDSDLESDDVAW